MKRYRKKNRRKNERNTISYPYPQQVSRVKNFSLERKNDGKKEEKTKSVLNQCGRQRDVGVQCIKVVCDVTYFLTRRHYKST